MEDSPKWTKKARYYSSVTGINLLALLFLWWSLSPNFIHRATAESQFSPNQPAVKSATKPVKPTISGEPVRLTIPSLNIDLPIDSGTYDPASNSWSLRDLRAQYAVYSALPNDSAGNTFLYGHNNYQTLGAIKSITPGTIAYIYTTNNHTFSYSFDSYSFVEPDDTSVLTYQGPPMLTIQTCTGVWNETRGMFKFSFAGVQ